MTETGTKGCTKWSHLTQNEPEKKRVTETSGLTFLARFVIEEKPRHACCTNCISDNRYVHKVLLFRPRLVPVYGTFHRNVSEPWLVPSRARSWPRLDRSHSLLCTYRTVHFTLREGPFLYSTEHSVQWPNGYRALHWATTVYRLPGAQNSVTTAQLQCTTHMHRPCSATRRHGHGHCTAQTVLSHSAARSRLLYP